MCTAGGRKKQGWLGGGRGEEGGEGGREAEVGGSPWFCGWTQSSAHVGSCIAPWTPHTGTQPGPHCRSCRRSLCSPAGGRSKGRKRTGWVQSSQRGDSSTGQDTNFCPDLAVPVLTQLRVSTISQSLFTNPPIWVAGLLPTGLARPVPWRKTALSLLLPTLHPSPRSRGQFLQADGGPRMGRSSPLHPRCG